MTIQEKHGLYIRGKLVVCLGSALAIYCSKPLYSFWSIIKKQPQINMFIL